MTFLCRRNSETPARFASGCACCAGRRSPSDLRQTKSIRKAAERMGMSYMRAWTLIKTMERCFKRPLVKAVRGGAKGGGAELTETGQRALALHQQLEAESLEAVQATWRELRGLLRD
ncbi:MAG: LysR family transcriptional regulator [Verrucomicrobia bacterium]|nr:MAG: LysR family transcriptional regulator [Verrucomicrobiota bacterium]